MGRTFKTRGIDRDSLVDFVNARRQKDGGFAFCNPLPSSAPETFYAVHILTGMDSEIPEKAGLLMYLKEKLTAKNIYSIRHALGSLGMLEENAALPEGLSAFLLEKLESAVTGRERAGGFSPGLGNTATYSFEMPNILEKIFYVCESLKMMEREIPGEARSFVERFRRGGGYGVKYPSLKDTYYCASILGSQGLKNRRGLERFIRGHELKSGGFCKRQGSYPPYLEDTFYALSALKTIGSIYRSWPVREYIRKLQNPDGGFRRSIYGGISSLEDSYYAVASLRCLRG